MIVTTLEAYEGTTPVYRCTLEDDQDPPHVVPGSVLQTLALTYFQDYTKNIIHSRDAQDVLSGHGVSVDEQGVLSWQLDPEDTEILNPMLRKEPHRAVFQWTWARADQSVGRGAHEVIILVTNLDHVTV